MHSGLITCRVSSRRPYFSEIRVSESKPSVSPFSPSPTSMCWPSHVTSTGFQTKERKLSPILGEGSGALQLGSQAGGKTRFTCLSAKLTGEQRFPRGDYPGLLGSWHRVPHRRHTHYLRASVCSYLKWGQQCLQDRVDVKTMRRGKENAQHYLTCSRC